MIDNFEEVCLSVSEGSSLITICNDRVISYGKAINWIYEDECVGGRKEKYERALVARGEYMAQRVLLELNRCGFSDKRKLYNDDGSLKAVSDLDDDVAACIAGIEVEDAKYDKDGEEIKGVTRKVKVVDKLKAIELYGKNLKMFTDKIDVSGTMSLEGLILGSMEPDDNKESVNSDEKQDIKEPDNGSEGQEQPEKNEASSGCDEI